jgi:uncharacterized protein
MRRLALLLLLWLGSAAWAQDVLPVPPLAGRVIDQTATLSAPQRAALEDKLAAFEAASGPQIVLLLVPTTAPEDIASYAQRVADSWKIGRRQVGDGLLLLVAKNDRTARIEVAKALEGAVPDLAARQVIDRALVPAFRAGDYAGGLNAALDLLMARIRGEGLPVPEPRGGGQGRRADGIPFDKLMMFFFIGVPVVGGVLSAIFGRKLAAIVTAGAAGGLAWWLSTSLLLALGAAVATVLVVGVFGIGTVLRLVAMGAGRGGGGGGGGGFSSGGGGDFGGGGASGRW